MGTRAGWPTLLLLLLAAFACCFAFAEPPSTAWILPLKQVTPGALSPDVTPATVPYTICAHVTHLSNWSTSKVRPPSSYTTGLKTRQLLPASALCTKPGCSSYSAFSQLWGSLPATYEADHLVPLELGGAPKDVANLWPQPHGPDGAERKDRLEGLLQSLVCAGKLELAEARSAIAEDWVAAYHRYAHLLGEEERASPPSPLPPPPPMDDGLPAEASGLRSTLIATAVLVLSASACSLSMAGVMHWRRIRAREAEVREGLLTAVEAA